MNYGNVPIDFTKRLFNYKGNFAKLNKIGPKIEQNTLAPLGIFRGIEVHQRRGGGAA